MTLAHLLHSGLVPTSGCKTPSSSSTTAKSTARPPIVRSTSYTAVPHPSKPTQVEIHNQGSQHSTPTVISIPSPPPTPSLNNQSSDTYSSRGLFSPPSDTGNKSYFHHHDIATRKQNSSSAPSGMSPLQAKMLSLSGSLSQMTPDGEDARSLPPTTAGFTFSSNITEEGAKEERDSFAFFLTTMEEDRWKSISTVRSTYFFDGIGRGGGFLAVSKIRSYYFFRFFLHSNGSTRDLSNDYILTFGIFCLFMHF